jgi:hypothetical protein
MNFKAIYLALRNPTIPLDDWPRTWRSHPRFVSQFPAASARVERLEYCSRVRQPTLQGQPVNSSELSQIFDGVALVASADESLHRSTAPAEIQAKIHEDERRVFSDVVNKSMVRGRETLVIGNAPGQVAIVRFLRRKAGFSRETFDEAWAAQAEQAKRFLSDCKIVRYVHTAILVPSPPGFEFDGVSETWFECVEDATRSLVDPHLAHIPLGFSDFCDVNCGVTVLGEVIYRLPRI